ncbi:MAG: hypothetical protein LUD17_14840 [Bacteroidales bacterium]|nr:hypothetical protein [Bacteroidales bacterium]
MKIPQLLIAAANSGSGKTTIAVGLMRTLRKRGLRVKPCKCGPDYIDTQFHRAAVGEPSLNLDLFMASEPYLRQSYSQWAQELRRHLDIPLIYNIMSKI